MHYYVKWRFFYLKKKAFRKTNKTRLNDVKQRVGNPDVGGRIFCSLEMTEFRSGGDLHFWSYTEKEGITEVTQVGRFWWFWWTLHQQFRIWTFWKMTHRIWDPSNRIIGIYPRKKMQKGNGVIYSIDSSCLPLPNTISSPPENVRSVSWMFPKIMGKPPQIIN